MNVTKIRCLEDEGAWRYRADFLPQALAEPLEIHFHIAGLPANGAPEPLGDPLLAALLPAAMHEGEALHVEGRVSRRLLDNLPTIQDILVAWNRGLLQRVEITADEVYDTPLFGPGRGVACCFSGGVDSWHSALKHQDRITHLMLAHGFDIALDNTELWDDTRRRMQAVADARGVTLLTVQTNLRLVADKRRCGWGRGIDYDLWGHCLHGPALASLALCLQNVLGELIVPSTYSYAELFPWGSHPLLDPLWCTENLTVTSDGCEAGRTAKVRAIAASDLALKHLRVCWQNRPGRFNCGVCEKCLRTLIALRLCGRLEAAASFERTLDLRNVRNVVFVSDHERVFWQGLRDEAEKAGDAELAKALRVACRRRRRVRRALAWVGRKAKGLLPWRLRTRLAR